MHLELPNNDCRKLYRRGFFNQRRDKSSTIYRMFYEYSKGEKLKAALGQGSSSTHTSTGWPIVPWRWVFGRSADGKTKFQRPSARA